MTRDTTAFARAERLYWRADTLARSLDPADVANALTLWREAVVIYQAGHYSKNVASTLDRIAGSYYDAGNLDSAFVYYTRALPIQHEVRDRQGEATSHTVIGLVHANFGRPDLALASYSRALPLWREIADSVGEATVHHNMGRALVDLGRPDSALAHYARALPIWRALGDREGQATTVESVGRVLESVGRPDSAKAYFGQALSIFRALRDSFGEARTLHSLGAVQHALGAPDSALSYYAQALRIRRAVGDRAGESTTLNNIGRVHDDLGMPDSALAYYAQALPLQRIVRDREGEGRTSTNIGRVLANLGRSDSALANYARALQILHDVGDLVGEATTLNNIATVQDNLGRPDSALAYYARALRVANRTPYRSTQASTLSNLGTIHFRLGRPDSALVYFGRALPINRELKDRTGEARTLGNIGLVQTSLGRHDSASVYYALALPIQNAVGDRTSEAATLANIGMLQAKLGRPDSTLAYLTRALAIQRAVGDRAGEATTLGNIGVEQARLGRPDSALMFFERALQIQRAVGDRPGQGRTFHNIGGVFLRSPAGAGTRLAAAMFDSAAALLGQVRRRAGGDANAVSYGETQSATFAAWSRAWQRLSEQAHLLGDSLAFTRAVASSLAAAERGRAQALRDLLEHRAGGRSAYLDGSDTLPGADLAAEVGLVLAPLRASHTALLYYLTDGDTLRAWFLSPNGALQILAPIAQSNGELIKRITAARTGIGADAAAARRLRGDNPFSHAESASAGARSGEVPMAGADQRTTAAALKALSAFVLPTALETLLAPGTELVIVPHGALGQVPFAALTLPGDTLPIGVRNPLRYAPSLRALAAAEAVSVKMSRRSLVVGNPLMPTVKDETGRPHRLKSLSGAQNEAKWVANRLGTETLTGAAASESAVRQRLSGASVIHLATHGLAYGTEAKVRDSYVALAAGGGHDGLFTLGELLDDDLIRLSADLIVLSACQTGLGETRLSEGTIGLQRGLLAKGARTVLVSLWSVDDAATRVLMERFYTHWLDQSGRPRISKAEALRLAQRDVRNRAQYRNPRYWAAFQLVGAR